VDLKNPARPVFYLVAGLADLLFGEKMARYRGEFARLVAVVAARVTGGTRSKCPLDLTVRLELDPASVRILTGQVEGSLPTQRWSKAKANEWYAAQPWLVGFNFLPSTAVNSVEMWQEATFDPATIDRELGWAEETGFNSCRVFLNFVVWEDDRDGLLHRIDRFLAIAATHGISVMPVLFDDCAFAAKGATGTVNPKAGPQAEPIPGVHNSRWVPCPGPAMVRDPSTYPRLEAYLNDVIGRFAEDDRILLWDLYNEPGNSGLGDESFDLVEAAFGWAWEVAPTQPLTVGTAGCQVVPPGGKIDTRRLELSDVNTFHTYGPRAALAADIARFKRYGRPALCTEWMARTLGSNWETDLPLLKQERVGCYHWGLVKGRSQTHYPWSTEPWPQEPDVWFCDLFDTDGTPYDKKEVRTISILTGRIKEDAPVN